MADGKAKFGKRKQNIAATKRQKAQNGKLIFNHEIHETHERRKNKSERRKTETEIRDLNQNLGRKKRN